MFICDWNGFDHELGELVEMMQAGKRAATPFLVLSLTASPSLQRQAADVFVRDKHPMNRSLGEIAKHPRKQKIRIAYYSANFHDHPVAHAIAELFEKHDRTKFELFGFSFGPSEKDEMRQRVSSAFDQFLDVRHQPDQAVAQLSRDLGVDIAIDLMGLLIAGFLGKNSACQKMALSSAVSTIPTR